MVLTNSKPKTREKTSHLKVGGTDRFGYFQNNGIKRIGIVKTLIPIKNEIEIAALI